VHWALECKDQVHLTCADTSQLLALGEKNDVH